MLLQRPTFKEILEVLKSLKAKLSKTEKPTSVSSPGLVTEEYVSESSSGDDASGGSDDDISSTEEGSYTSSSQVTDLTYGGIVEED